VTLSLAERILALEAAFERARIPHAFGGALALAFHVEEPRATRDIDVNVFVAPEEVARVFEALPAGVAWDGEAVLRVERDGQVRIFWDETPVDLFFSTHAFHDVAWLDVERVPFDGGDIPILGATELVVFKAFFNRTRDWADIEAMIDADAPDIHLAIGWVVDLLGTDDPRVDHLQALVSRRPGPEPRFEPPATA
jgi:hypothetical protein